MSEFTSIDFDENGNKIETHLDEGEVSIEKMVEYIEAFKNVDYGVLVIDHIDTKTNTVYFYSDQV
jgi:hypothetical protein